VEILGVKLVGVNAENGKKLLFTPVVDTRNATRRVATGREKVVKA